MKRPRSTYVHRGDAVRRRNRVRSFLALVGIASAAVLVIANRRPSTPTAEAASVSEAPGSFSFGIWGSRSLRRELDDVTGEATLLRAQLDRANRIIGFSSKYEIPADLAATIFDVALSERLDPELAFELVNLESNFNPRAMSPVGAIGLAQVMPSTAVLYDRTVTREDLYVPRTNLRIGFQYLRRLIGLYGGDVRLALLAYNVGEAQVDKARAEGRNPLDGYNRILLRQYQGTGVSD
jgi:hypothetical protein